MAEIPEGGQADKVRRILATFLGLGEGDTFDAALLDQMTPELVFRLDMIAGKFLELDRTREAARALRGALVSAGQVGELCACATHTPVLRAQHIESRSFQA